MAGLGKPCVLSITLAKGKSLAELAMEAVIRNILLYVVPQWKKANTLQLASLPISLQQKVAKELLSKRCTDEDLSVNKYKKQLRLYQAVLKIVQPKEVDIGGLMSYCPLHMQKKQLLVILKWILIHLPKIETLKFTNCNIFDLDLQYKPASIEDQLIDCICNMQHLKQLEFGDFQIISYYNLRHICEALKNSLNHLQARIDLPQDDICRSSLKHSFQNLKVFRFEEFMVGEDGVRRRLNNGPLTQLCVRSLTKLQVVQDYVDGQSHPPPMNTDTCCGRSDLQQLSVEAETASEKLPLLFQKVTRLQVKWIGSNDTNIDSLLQFRHVSVLVLDNFSSNRMLDAFLKRYGGQLHTLSLRVGSESKLCLKFATVFKACPNLERLFLEGLEMTDTSVITAESFTSLKEVRWSQKR
ncbi:uncharacterized protein LOC135947999 [Cloeon dipterum]|uniref:uncharacterized protein LOC135947999 n=1 Tax=Cloeon dipterum TaxID=197152 RepID=UPI0032200E32